VLSIFEGHSVWSNSRKYSHATVVRHTLSVLEGHSVDGAIHENIRMQLSSSVRCPSSKDPLCMEQLMKIFPRNCRPAYAVRPRRTCCAWSNAPEFSHRNCVRCLSSKDMLCMEQFTKIFPCNCHPACAVHLRRTLCGWSNSRKYSHATVVRHTLSVLEGHVAHGAMHQNFPT
jgi:hypothetical protein